MITTGGKLKARHVIHAVGPVWRGGDEEETELLASAYRRSLEVAAEHGLQSVSFPSISTGAFAFPIRLAAPIAVRTVIGFLREGAHAFDEVRFVLYVREDARALEVFAAALAAAVAGAAKGQFAVTSLVTSSATGWGRREEARRSYRFSATARREVRWCRMFMGGR